MCLSVPRHIPTLLHGPECNLGNGEFWFCTIGRICNRCTDFVAIQHSAEREMSASACTRSMPGWSVWDPAQRDGTPPISLLYLPWSTYVPTPKSLSSYVPKLGERATQNQQNGGDFWVVMGHSVRFTENGTVRTNFCHCLRAIARYWSQIANFTHYALSDWRFSSRWRHRNFIEIFNTKKTRVRGLLHSVS